MRIATEHLSIADATQRLNVLRRQARVLDARFRFVCDVSRRRRLLELGAAFGGLAIGFAELGYTTAGVEPDETALATAKAIADDLEIPCPIVKGTAERIPFPDDSFDIVIASSVLEHVQDIRRTFEEVARVLRPGGMFYFSMASSMCPRQKEIRGFPFFGWYPNRMKLRIMAWARDHRPSLVGYTSFPAINWFSDGKAVAHLRAAGFDQVWDRWDMRQESQGGKVHGIAIKLIKRSLLFKRIANAMVPMCAYAAIKRHDPGPAHRDEKQRWEQAGAAARRSHDHQLPVGS